MEEGEGHHILGHLGGNRGRAVDDDGDSQMLSRLGKSGESYEDDESALYSI